MKFSREAFEYNEQPAMRFFSKERLRHWCAGMLALLDGTVFQEGKGVDLKRGFGIVEFHLARLARRGAGAATRWPWEPKPGPSGGLNICLTTGVVNGVSVPSNANSEFLLTDDSDNYVYLEATLAAGVMTALQYSVATSLPTQQTPAANAYPTKMYQALCNVPCANGAIDWSNWAQYVHGPLALITYLHDLTGQAPSYDKELRIVFAGN